MSVGFDTCSGSGWTVVWPVTAAGTICLAVSDSLVWCRFWKTARPMPMITNTITTPARMMRRRSRRWWARWISAAR